MQKNKLPLLLIALLAVSMIWTGCYKDLGNYDYHDINEAVKFDSIRDQYTLLYKDTLKIVPVISFTQDKSGDTSRYSYSWEMVMQNRLPGDTVRRKIGSSRNLAYVINVKAAKYICYYIITDKQTGVSWQHPFNLQVQSAVYEGWIALCNVKGIARLDMLSKFADKYVYIKDLLTYTNSGLVPQHDPKHISMVSNTNGVFLYLLSGDGTNKLEAENFTWKDTYTIAYDMMSGVPANFRPTVIFPFSPGFIYMVANGQAYFQNQVMGKRGYGLPINRVDDMVSNFTPAPFGAAGYFAFGNAVLYDETGKQFVQHDGYGDICHKLSSDTIFSFQTGKSMVYMADTRFNNGDTYAVLKDAANKYSLYRFNISYDGIAPTAYLDMKHATDIDKATNFAVSQQYGSLFYVVGSKLYQYDTFSDETHLMLDLGTEQISYIQCPMRLTNFVNQIVVCSYNPALPEESSGALTMYEVPSRNEPLIKGATYTGFGKIIDLVYRSR